MEYNHIEVYIVLLCFGYFLKSASPYLSGSQRERPIIQIPLELSFVRSLANCTVRRNTLHMRPPSLLTLTASSGVSQNHCWGWQFAGTHRTHSKLLYSLYTLYYTVSYREGIQIKISQGKKLVSLGKYEMWDLGLP